MRCSQRILRYALALPLLWLLTGCPADPVCVEAINKRASSLTLDFTEGRGCVRSPEVSSISVVRESDEKVLWSIQSSDLDRGWPTGKQLNRFTYGLVPEEFEESSHSIKLRSGELITIFANASPNHGGITLTLN